MLGTYRDAIRSITNRDVSDEIQKASDLSVSTFHAMDIVGEAFVKVAEKSKKFKTTEVEKLVDLDFDLGCLLAIDTNDVNEKALRSDKKDTYLLNLARDNTQLLFNKIWALPTERVEEAIVVKLPKPTFITPREKPVPKPKPLTKWQQFAKEKGLQRIKKPKSTWDDILQKWVPRHGYRKATAEKEKDWLIEVPQNVDPYKDMFESKLQAKQERVAKNEFQRLRNIAAAKKIKVPRFGLPTADKQNSEQLKVAAKVARVSTASIGKFQPRLRKEKKKSTEEMDKLLPGTRKRKLPMKSREQEKNASLSIIDSILNKKPKLDIEKAVNKHLFEEQQERAKEKQKPQPKKSGKKRTLFQGKRGKGAGKTKSSAKPSGGKGKRLKSGGGRKRR